MPLTLPHLHGLDGMDEHEDIEGEIVADPPETAEFEDNDEDDADPDLREAGDDEADDHHEDIADGIQDTVADIAERDRRFAVAVDDEG